MRRRWQCSWAETTLPRNETSISLRTPLDNRATPALADCAPRKLSAGMPFEQGPREKSRFQPIANCAPTVLCGNLDFAGPRSAAWADSYLPTAIRRSERRMTRATQKIFCTLRRRCCHQHDLASRGRRFLRRQTDHDHAFWRCRQRVRRLFAIADATPRALHPGEPIICGCQPTRRRRVNPSELCCTLLRRRTARSSV